MIAPAGVPRATRYAFSTVNGYQVYDYVYDYFTWDGTVFEWYTDKFQKDIEYRPKSQLNETSYEYGYIAIG